MNYTAEFNQYCAVLPIKLTSLRKAVLAILWGATKPLKAYDILPTLLEEKSNATPASVYRALDFFVEAAVVHKIESIQSYTLCGAPQKQLTAEMLMVCHQCHQVIEIYDDIVRDRMSQITQAHAFSLKQDAIEIKGVCGQCV